MEKSKIAKVKTKKMNKKAIMGLITKVCVFLIVILALIIGSVFTATSFANKANLAGDFGKNYNGYYDIKVATYDANTSKPDDDKKLGNAEQGYKILRDKIDPLSIKNFDIQIIGDNYIKMTIPKSLYSDFAELQTDIERQGAIYFTDAEGNDLLVDSATNTRVKLSDVIETSESKVHKITRQPIISLKFKDKTKWDSMMEKNKDKPLIIWTDIPNFIDKVRHDSSNYTKWKSYFKDLIASKQLTATEKKAVKDIFEFKTDGKNDARLKGNLLDINDLPMANAIFRNAKLEFDVKVNDTDGLLIDPNNDKKGEAKNPYLDPLRGANAKQILMKLYALDKEKYAKYLLNTESTNFNPELNKDNTEAYDIVVDTATRATQIETLINGSLKGLSFKIESYSDNLAKNITKSVGFIAGIVVVSLATSLIVIFLLVYYRLFGLITIISISFTALLSLFLGSLLNISVGLEVVSALFIAICLIVYANVLLYERYKRERFNNNKQILTSFKIANKASLPAVIDTAIVVLILGLAFFWGGSGILKSFATILIISIATALVAGIFTTRLLYYLAVKLKMVDNKFLAIPKNALFISLKKKKNTTVKANLMADNNEVIEVASENSDDSSSNVKVKKNSLRKVSWLSVVKWTPFGAVSLIILAVILGFTVGINKAPNISQGQQYTISDQIIISDNLEQEIKEITKSFNSQQDFKNKFNFEINKIVISTFGQFDEQAIEINTNITNDTLHKKVLSWLYNKYTSDEQFIKTFKLKSTAAQSVIIESIIALAISIGLILVYLLFRLDWAQFTAIVIGVLSTLLISFAIVALAQLTVSFEMIACFITIVSLTLMTGVIMMSRAKQIKTEVAKEVYENFWNEEMEYNQTIKKIKKQHKLFIKSEIDKLNNTNEKLTDPEYKERKQEIYRQAKAMKKEDYKKIAQIRKEFRTYEQENNFLINISKRTILESTKNLIIMSFIFITLIIALLFFPLVLTNNFSFEILLAIGTFTGIYATLFVILPIWSLLEKKRTLSNLRVRKFLDSKRVGLDEQLIKGINS